jgi:Protein of unknown function (DUF3025)
MDFSHLAFGPYRELLAALPGSGLPTACQLNAVASEFSLEFRFAESPTPLSAADYERGIYENGSIPTRPGNVHDFMNALVWLRFPTFKTVLNRAHCHALAENANEARQRSPLRDALTVLDESGVVMFTKDSAFSELLGERRWQELFVGRRKSLMEQTQFIVVGHSVLEKLLAPYRSITGKCLVVSGLPQEFGQADQMASHAVTGIHSPKTLPPLPVAGIPGWHPDNHLAHFYDDRTVFRPLAQ